MKTPLIALLALTLLGAGCRPASPRSGEPPRAQVPTEVKEETTPIPASIEATTTTSTPAVAPKPTTKPAVKAPVKKPTVVTSQVQIKDVAFSPQILAVSAGDAVVWTNAGSKNQTVTSGSNLWDSGNLKPGQTYRRVFSQPGRYEYRSNLTNGMTGTIIVGPVRP